MKPVDVPYRARLDRPSRYWPQCVMVCIFASHSVLAWAQAAVDIERIPNPVERAVAPSNTLPHTGPASMPATSGAAAVDERSLWYHLHRADRAMVRLELQRLRALHPNWTPEGDLRRAIDRLLNPAGPTAPAAPSTGKAVSVCADPQAAWRKAAGRRKPLVAILLRCPDPGIAEGTLTELLRGRRLSEQIARLEALPTTRLAPAVRAVVEQRLYALRLEMFAHDGGAKLPADWSDELAQQIRQRNDAAAALLVGWRKLAQGDTPAALTWFELADRWGQHEAARSGIAASHAARAQRAIFQEGDLDTGMVAIQASLEAGGDPAESIAWALYEQKQWAEAERVFALAGDPEVAAYGRALARQAAGDLFAATDIACGSATLSERLAGLCTELERAAFWAHWRSNDPAATIARGLQLERRLSTPPAEIAEIMAWAYLALDQADEAARRFVRMLSPAMSPELASGLIDSLIRAGRADELDALAVQSPALAEKLRARRSRLAAARGQYALEAMLSAAPNTDTTQWLLQSGLTRSASRGANGLDRLELDRRDLGLRFQQQGLRIDLGVRRSALSAGYPAPDAALGLRHPPTTTDSHAPQSAADADEWLLRARLERPDYTVQGELRSLPKGGAVDHDGVRVGLAYTRYHTRASTRIALRSAPRQDSLLSFAGQIDPVSGQRWGGALDTTIELSQYLATDEHAGLTLTYAQGRITGRHLPTNRHRTLQIDYRRDLRPADWAYFRVGPFAAWTAYAHNLSHFTYGHGGYYSPERDVSIGVRFDGLTATGSNWIARVEGSLAWAEVDEAAAARFPGQKLTGPAYPAARNSGARGDLQVRAAWRLSPGLVLQLGAGAASARQFDHWWFGLGLSMPLQAGHRLSADDLFTLFDRRD